MRAACSLFCFEQNQIREMKKMQFDAICVRLRKGHACEWFVQAMQMAEKQLSEGRVLMEMRLVRSAGDLSMRIPPPLPFLPALRPCFLPPLPAWSC